MYLVDTNVVSELRKPRPHPLAIAWLRGGTRAWSAAGHPLEQAWRPGQLLTPFDDDFGSVMRVLGARRGAVWRDYLAWERGVAARIVRDPTVRFRFFAG